ncbi:hypothetical protein AAFN85_27205 [Mucilaginibacter sp. CAU 1740]|uniref:hypothetical protein n=1 Tax=Mucilaginibacter sp. CAU 1740 TaxID=3140365 RepID=UPI00325AC76A
MIVLTREEIYRLVWETPMTLIAEKYAISDVGFRKLCIRMDVPFPKRGYWAKIKAGYKLKRPFLPVTGKNYLPAKLKERPDGTPVKKQSQLKLHTRKVASEKLPFKVPDRLIRPEPVTLAARESLKKLTDSNYPGMAITGKRELDIKVSPANIGRALRFMDTLIKCIRARGYLFELDDEGSYVVIRNIRLKITFRERTTRIRVHDKSYWNYEWHPNGKVVFRIEARLKSEWQDLKAELLEEQLPKILAKLELTAKEEELYLERARIWQADWERERKQKAEFEARKKQEKDAYKQLMKNAERWKQAQLIREFTLATPDADPQWFSWANAKADWLDPYNPAEDDWLNDADKDDL